jgi:hypothetical protein
MRGGPQAIQGKSKTKVYQMDLATDGLVKKWTSPRALT